MPAVKNKYLKLFRVLASAFILCHDVHAQKAVGRENRLETANWNLEWFGKTAPGFGPADDRRQLELARHVIGNSAIDIWALCEISDKVAFDSLCAGLPSYASILATYSPEQKTAVLYDTARFGCIASRMLATDSPDSFSTGRFPLEVTLLNKTPGYPDTLTLIVIHLKANTGNQEIAMKAWESRRLSAVWLQNYLRKQGDRKAILIAGDWNDDTDISVFVSLPSPFAGLNRQTGGRFLTEVLTRNNISTTAGYPDPVDHQYASQVLADYFVEDSAVVWRLDREIAGFADSCSDHFPVWSVFARQTAGITAGIRPENTLYPNPAHNKVWLNMEGNGRELILFSPDGKIVFKAEAAEDGSIDLSMLDAGMYIYETKSDQNLLRGILIIE